MDICGSVHKATQKPRGSSLFPTHQMHLTSAKSGQYLPLDMQQLAEGVTLMEDGLRNASDGCARSELINRCFLSSLYEAQLAAHFTALASNTVRRLNSESDSAPTDIALKAMRNLERATGLATQLYEYEVLTYCAIGLADLQISRRDLAAASLTFDGCVACCAGIADAPLRASLLQRVLPKSMEVCNMQGRTADSFARLQLLNTVLALNGRNVAEECPICGEAMTRDRACLALGCGHSFHRDCCDCWLGRKMFMCGSFRAECPVCTQVDWSLKPTPAAARALEEFKLACGEGGSGSGSNGGPAGRGFAADSEVNGSVSGRGSDSSSSSSSSAGGSSGSTAQAGRAGTGDGARVESGGSSCSGSSSDGDWEDEVGGEDCAQSEVR